MIRTRDARSQDRDSDENRDVVHPTIPGVLARLGDKVDPHSRDSESLALGQWVAYLLRLIDL